MSVRVGELVSQLRSRSRAVNVRLGDVELLAEGDSAGVLRVGEERLPWGDRTTQMVASFLGGPGYKYLLREPLAWQRQVIKHHTDKNADTESVWYIEGHSVAGVYHQDDKIIPLVRVAEQVADVFSPDDYANVLYGTDQVEINVLSNVRTVTVPGIPGIESRPLDGTVEARDGRRVGDLSAGGVRVIIQPGKPERAPIVEEFWERLVCTNGMTRRVSGSQINLRGRTVEEILTEMNNVMRVIWEGLDGSAQAILHSAETPIPGAVSDFLRRVARERGINAATILRLQERAAALPANPTVYDVTQIVTDMANEDGLPVLTRRNLQAIGGDLTVDTERMVHRCTQCEQPLVAA
ncbi:MAG TPA: hypothetical protein VIY48_15100 [Candidatus Paceibacterota bacterium]